MRIEPATSDTLPAARALVDRVFGAQGPAASLFFWMYGHRESQRARLLMHLRGIEEFTALWVALDENGSVIGTSGLCRYRRDAGEAVWLSWLCVAPESRRVGVAGRLLDFTIDRARAAGFPFLRLHTSDIRNEAAAQSLYERHGLKVCEVRNRIFYRLISRELSLK